MHSRAYGLPRLCSVAGPAPTSSMAIDPLACLLFGIDTTAERPSMSVRMHAEILIGPRKDDQLA